MTMTTTHCRRGESAKVAYISIFHIIASRQSARFSPPPMTRRIIRRRDAECGDYLPDFIPGQAHGPRRVKLARRCRRASQNARAMNTATNIPDFRPRLPQPRAGVPSLNTDVELRHGLMAWVALTTRHFSGGSTSAAVRFSYWLSASLIDIASADFEFTARRRAHAF